MESMESMLANEMLEIAGIFAEKMLTVEHVVVFHSR
jgi:hypothetical protein